MARRRPASSEGRISIERLVYGGGGRNVVSRRSSRHLYSDKIYSPNNKTQPPQVGTYRNDNTHFPKQNFYDYAEFFDGDLSSCTYSRGPCAWASGKECLTLTCLESAIQCPPRNLPECPDWTYDACKNKRRAAF